MDQHQDLPPRDPPAPRLRLIDGPEMLAVAGLCFVITGVGLIHLPSAIIIAGLAQIGVAVALART